MKRQPWRQGSKVPLNVYEGDRPVCQCHNADDAGVIVGAVDLMLWLRDHAPETLATWLETKKRETERANNADPS